MTKSIAETTERIVTEGGAAETLAALIDDLQTGAQVGRTGFRWYEKLDDGTWSGPENRGVTTAEVVAALAGGGEVVIDEPARRVALPATAVAPEVAAWDRLAEASAATLTTEFGEPDPFIIVPRPAWADLDRWDGTVVGGEDDYRFWSSKPVYITYPARKQNPAGSVLAHAAFKVNVTQGAVDGATYVKVIRDACGEQAKLLCMRPRTARRLAEAILAAARLADPDDEFDEAGDL